MTSEGAAFAPAFVAKRDKRRDLSSWVENRKNKPSWERHQEEALVTSAKKRDDAPKKQPDALRATSPYWDVTIYTEEEFNAYLDDDELTPELAERYKDLLED